MAVVLQIHRHLVILLLRLLKTPSSSPWNEAICDPIRAIFPALSQRIQALNISLGVDGGRLDQIHGKSC